MQNEDSKCIDHITGLLHKIDDPVHLSNVHDWVIKLTTGKRSTVKTDYLKLLEHVLTSGESIREPFVQPPPDGPLAGFKGLARPGPGRWSLAAGGNSTGMKCQAEEVGSCSEEFMMGCRETDTCPELTELEKRTDGGTLTLQEFMAGAKLSSCDGGQLMDQAVDELLSEFRTTAEAAFEDRTRKLCDALAVEQATLLLRYRNNERRALSRAQILQDHLRELMPTFQYDEYMEGPDNHIRLELAKIKAAAEEVQGSRQNGMTDDGHPENGTDPVGQEKKMMRALDWLRTELNRADCENAALCNRYDAVMASIVAAGKAKIKNECRTKDRKRELKLELDELRRQSSEKAELIACYVQKLSSESRNDAANTECSR